MRKFARDVAIAVGYMHPAVLAVALRRGPRAAKRYLAELYRCSKTDAGSHLPAVPVESLYPEGTSFRVFRPNDLTGTMSAVEIATVCQIVASAKPRKVVEIGTFRGVTTRNIALNAPCAEIHTLDLPPDYDPAETAFENADADVIRKRGQLVFQNTAEEARICRHLGDSATYDFNRIGTGVDLALIDAAHSYEYVRNDTAAVLPLMDSQGVLLWHDYACADFLQPPHLSWGVSKLLHQLRDLGVVVLKSTSIGFLRLNEQNLAALRKRLARG